MEESATLPGPSSISLSTRGAGIAASPQATEDSPFQYGARPPRPPPNAPVCHQKRIQFEPGPTTDSGSACSWASQGQEGVHCDTDSTTDSTVSPCNQVLDRRRTS